MCEFDFTNFSVPDFPFKLPASSADVGSGVWEVFENLNNGFLELETGKQVHVSLLQVQGDAPRLIPLGAAELFDSIRDPNPTIPGKDKRKKFKSARLNQDFTDLICPISNQPFP